MLSLTGSKTDSEVSAVEVMAEEGEGEGEWQVVEGVEEMEGRIVEDMVGEAVRVKWEREAEREAWKCMELVGEGVGVKIAQEMEEKTQAGVGFDAETLQMVENALGRLLPSFLEQVKQQVMAKLLPLLQEEQLW